MDLGLDGKTAFVTASSGGIGLAIAEGLLMEGATVAINGRNQEHLDLVVSDFRRRAGMGHVSGIQGNMRYPEDIRRAARHYGSGVDVLVANLGGGKPAVDQSCMAGQLDVAEWQRVLDLNLMGAVALVGEFWPSLRQGASIVLVASVAGLERTGAPVQYAAAKAALVSFAKNIAPSLAERDVRINVVAPGNILFPGGRWDEISKDDPAATEAALRQTPMRRFGTPWEVADAVVWLASPRSSFCTGSVIVVDGGLTKS